MRKNIKKISVLLIILIAVTSCANNDVLTEPITNTDYFMKLPVEELNVKINSDDYYLRSAFYSEYDLFWCDMPDNDNYSLDETWPRLFRLKNTNVNNTSVELSKREFNLDYIGYINKDSEIVIEPKYAFGDNFENGIATVDTPVTLDGLGETFFLNEDGSKVKNLNKFEGSYFQNGIATTKYKKDDKSANEFAIDTKGNLLYDKEKREVRPITLMKDSHTLGSSYLTRDKINAQRYVFLISAEGEILIPEEDKFIRFEGGGKKYIFGYKNFGDKYTHIPLEIEKYEEEYDVRVAVLDLEGNVVSKWMDFNFKDRTIMGRYKFNEYCSDDLILIYDTLSEKFGYMSITGDIVIEPQFELANPFFEGLASVSDGEKYGFIDTSGKLVIPMKYDIVGETEHRMSIGYPNDRRQVNTGPFSAVYFSQGLCAVNENGKYGFIDKTGNFVIPPQFDGPSNFYEDVATCKIGNYYYIIEKKK